MAAVPLRLPWLLLLLLAPLSVPLLLLLLFLLLLLQRASPQQLLPPPLLVLQWQRLEVLLHRLAQPQAWPWLQTSAPLPKLPSLLALLPPLRQAVASPLPPLPLALRLSLQSSRMAELSLMLLSKLASLPVVL